MSLRALPLTTIALTAHFLMACPGNSPVKAPAKIDGSSTPAYLDGGHVPPPSVDASAALPPAADAQVATPVADYGIPATGTLTCVQIFDCYETCAETDNACFDACFYKGSVDGQAKASALEECDYTAETGACKTQCVNWNSQTCWSCLDQACGAQATACGF